MTFKIAFSLAKIYTNYIEEKILIFPHMQLWREEDRNIVQHRMRNSNRVWFLVIGMSRNGKAAEEPGVVVGQSSQSIIYINMKSFCFALLAHT